MCKLIDPHGRYLPQRRDSNPNILYPGKIGLFGGHREGAETFLGCVVREVYEEAGYLAGPDQFEHLGTNIGPDREIQGATVVGHYLLRNVLADSLNVTEGSLIIVRSEELADADQPLFESPHQFMRGREVGIRSPCLVARAKILDRLLG